MRKRISIAGHKRKAGDKLVFIYKNIEGCNGFLADAGILEIDSVTNYWGGWGSLEEAKKYGKSEYPSQGVSGTVTRITRGLCPQGQAERLVIETGLPFVEIFGYEPENHEFKVSAELAGELQ